MKRRTVLKALAGGCMIGPSILAGSKGVRRFRLGKGGTTKKLVVLFQRGGNDGLNTLIPMDSGEYALYQNLRPDVRIPFGEIQPLSGQSFFGWHPRLNALLPIYNMGNLSLIHAVGYPGSDRSHFESQSYYETAVPGNGLLDGWLNRLLNATSGAGLIRGLSIGYNIPQSVTGGIPVPVSTNFGSLNLNVDPYMEGALEDPYRQKIRDLYALAPSAGNENLYNTGDKIFQMIENFADRNLVGYAPENGAQYPLENPSNPYGFPAHMMHAAQMLKDDATFLGVEVIAIDQGGYDTHANQLDPGNPTSAQGGHGELLKEMADSMAAFYTDMGPTRMNDIIVMVVSEFGRRAYQNDSNGTDHGTGSLVMVMGNGVNGSIINGGGSWPGLNNLYQGDDLMWVTDYRNIYWEVLVEHLGLDQTAMQNIIPGHTYSPVGFLT